MGGSMGGSKTAKGGSKKRRQRERGRSKHSGVVILRKVWASGRTTYGARWKDPATGKTIERQFSAIAPHITTAESREVWAAKKAKQLSEERARIARGEVAREGPRTVADAIEVFLEAKRGECAPRTVTSYAGCLRRFQAWADSIGLAELRHLQPVQLVKLRDWLIAQPRTKKRARGTADGAPKEAGEPRSAATISRDLRHIKGFLFSARDRGYCALTGDDIRARLKPVKGRRRLKPMLRRAEIRRALEAARRHDAEVFAMTREERAAGVKAGEGTTPRYRPIAPMVLAALLSGCRTGELRLLRWEDVHLAAPGRRGEGEFIIQPQDGIKGKRARAVDLAVSPALARLLAALELTSDGSPLVFGMSEEDARKAMLRLRETYGAPAKLDWQACRSTCGSFLACSPGIFGAASATRESQQLGHGVVVAEQHYIGRLRDIPPTATTLEAAMEIEDLAAQIIRDVSEPGARLEASAG